VCGQNHNKGGFLMKKAVRSIAVFLFVITVSLFPFNTALAQSGGYIGVFGGYTFSPDVSLRVGGDFGYKFDLDVQNSWALGAKVGYAPPQIRFLSFELEYIYLSPSVNRTVLAPAVTDFAAVEMDSTLHNLLYNIKIKYPEGRFHPYLGAGIGISFVDVSAKLTARLNGVNQPTQTVSDNKNGLAWQVLAGVEIDLTNSLSADLGYRYFSTEPKFDDLKLEYNTSMLTLGLNYRF
jgi:opacity protein-like surface antigen